MGDQLIQQHDMLVEKLTEKDFGQNHLYQKYVREQFLEVAGGISRVGGQHECKLLVEGLEISEAPGYYCPSDALTVNFF